ncbi:Isochorismatase hydrolase [Stereum hirsutum FP-91666 SS1]|uniref:Isochorismatase hydrolase n=1 Tax=Stereum hirsutum (strain FP-91666) TaxID=721885 RepID=UPI000440DD46|nr:Isochorismatase hydrolase [Stereum hirsutum FP-91666 SS1]EIM88303.1 Isochorismatase hydrolase [Stereum hirsutum FP-91666 SS1]
MAQSVVKIIPGRTVFFVCDLQTKFRTAIHAFEEVILTSQKMLKLATILEIPVIFTEQNPKALGPTVPELSSEALGPLHLGTIEKTLFSMMTPEVTSLLRAKQFRSIVLFGIESHVCVLQSALDLLAEGYGVHVLADGVSSCNKEEVPYALARMRQAGAQITTSESLLFQLQRDGYRIHFSHRLACTIGDSSTPEFRSFARAIKEEKENTTKAVQALLQARDVF